MLVRYPLLRIEIHSWNTFYDQVWVRKFGVLSVEGRGAEDLADWLEDAEAYCLQGGIVTSKKRANGRNRHIEEIAGDDRRSHLSVKTDAQASLRLDAKQ